MLDLVVAKRPVFVDGKFGEFVYRPYCSFYLEV